MQRSLGPGRCLCTPSPVFAVYLPSIGLQDQLFSKGFAAWVGMAVDRLIWSVFVAPGVGRKKTQCWREMGSKTEGLSSPVEGVALDIRPHHFHAACVDQEPSPSLHTCVNHVLCACGGKGQM